METNVSSGGVKRLLAAPLRRVRRLVARALKRPRAARSLKSFHTSAESELSPAELLAFARHDAHRIEKAFYNRIFWPKHDYYELRRANVLRSVSLLKEQEFDAREPTLVWAQNIAETFDQLEDRFIKPRSSAPRPIDEAASDGFLALVSSRRSSRVWAEEQPPREALEGFARRMIDAARWAPNSGNRQPWRFRIISDDAEKLLLKGIKEEHCYAAPCLVFVGSDRRVYGALGRDEAGIHIDAGAATMQMVLAAHASHFGVCWNHFSRDLIESREVNRELYVKFARALGIPDYIEPIAIVAFGAAEFHPPVPPRMDVDSLLL